MATATGPNGTNAEKTGVLVTAGISVTAKTGAVSTIGASLVTAMTGAAAAAMAAAVLVVVAVKAAVTVVARAAAVVSTGANQGSRANPAKWTKASFQNASAPEKGAPISST